MNKNNLLILIFSLVLILGGLYVYNSGKSTNTDTLTENNLNESEQIAVTDQNNDVQDEDLISMLNAPNGANVYKFNNSTTVSYVTQKRFLQKEDATVTGTSTNVSGGAWFNPENNSMYVLAMTDFTDFATDSEKRDSDVAKFFNDTSIKLVAESTLNNLTMGEEFTTTVNTMLTINGVTKEVPFEVTATVTESGFTAKGNAKVLMSDFGITPPSLAGVFSVDDEFEINFDVSADKLEVSQDGSNSEKSSEMEKMMDDEMNNNDMMNDQ